MSGFTISSGKHGEFMVLVDPGDMERVSEFAWSVKFEPAIGRVKAIQRNTKGGTVYLHRWLMSAPVGIEVDHINGDVLDNRRCNLRLASHIDNSHNRRRRGVAVNGIRRIGDRWGARIGVAYRRIHLGVFDTHAEAVAARQAAEAEHYGEFSPTLSRG